MRASRRWESAGVVAVGVLAAFLFCNFVLDWMLRGFTGMGDVISELEAPGQPNATVLRTTDVGCALLVLALLPAVSRVMPANRSRTVFLWSVVAFAVGAVLSALLAWPCGPDESCGSVTDWARILLHSVTSGVSEVGLFASVWAARSATRGVGPGWFRAAALWIFWLGGVLMMALFGLSYGFVNVLDIEAFDVIPVWLVGLFQRVHVGSGGLWMILLAGYAVTQRPVPRGS